MFGDCREDVNSEAIRFGEIASGEINTRFHERANEMDIARQTVQFGNHQCCLMQTAEPEGLCYCGAIIALAALHLDQLLHKLPFAAV